MPIAIAAPARARPYSGLPLSTNRHVKGVGPGFGLTPPLPEDRPIEADMILINARVLTMDGANPRAEAVAVRDGRILAVGRAAAVAALAGPSSKVIDARGRTLLPGFVESHCHLFMAGAGWHTCNWAGSWASVR